MFVRAYEVKPLRLQVLGSLTSNACVWPAVLEVQDVPPKPQYRAEDVLHAHRALSLIHI